MTEPTEAQARTPAMTEVTPDAYLYTSDDGAVELILDCHGEQARRLLELGYTECPLYTRPASTEPADALDRDYTKRRIKELTDEGDSFWRPCSGCQESSEGCVSTKDYPYSDTFRCQPGSGCGECGGIGVIWDDTDWEDYAKFDLSAPPDPEQAPALTRTDALAEARDALEAASVWHETEDKSISKQPNANIGQNGWQRMMHQEQAAILRTALANLNKLIGEG